MKRFILALIVAASVVACSGTPETVTCGPGTTLVGSQCAASQDASVSDSSPALDGTTPDAFTSDAYAPAQDGSLDSSLLSDGDAGEPPPDPCPIFGPITIDGGQHFQQVNYDCDPACATTPWDGSQSDQAACASATCSGGETLMACSTFCSGNTADLTAIRTPNAPGIDSACAKNCPANPWAYGISATYYGIGVGYTVKVSPPWYLVSGTTTPFCPDATSPPTNCLWFDGTTNPIVYIVTTDPNAPARNVISENGPSCP